MTTPQDTQRWREPSIDHWPVVVTQSRYGGTYEGSSWQAWPGGTFPGWDSDHAAFGDDGECMEFWYGDEDPLARRVGRGGTPNEAVEDMLRRSES